MKRMRSRVRQSLCLLCGFAGTGCDTNVTPAPPELGDVIGGAPQVVALFHDTRIRISDGSCVTTLTSAPGKAIGTASWENHQTSIALEVPAGSRTDIFPAQAAEFCVLEAGFDVIGNVGTANGHVTLFADLVSEGAAAVPFHSVSISLIVLNVATDSAVGNDIPSIDFCEEDSSDCDQLPGTQRLVLEVGDIDFVFGNGYIARVGLSAGASSDAPFGSRGGTLGLSLTVDRIEVGFGDPL